MNLRSVTPAPETETTARRPNRARRLGRAPAGSAPTTFVVATRTLTAGPALPGPIDAGSHHSTKVAISPRTLRRRQVVADVAAVVAGLITAVFLVENESSASGRLALIALVTGVAWMLCVGLNGLHKARAVSRPSEEMRRIAVAGVTGTGLAILVASVTRIGVPDGWAATSFATVTGFLVAERLLARWAFMRLRAAGRMRRRVAIVGTDRNAQELCRSVEQRPELGYDVVGYIEVGEHRHGVGAGRILGHVSDAEHVLTDGQCVGALVSLSSVNAAQVNRLSRKLTDAGFHVALATSLRDFDATRLRPQAIGEQTLVYLEPTIRGGWRSHAKRAFDLVLAGIGLVITAPIIAMAALAIRLDSKGPVFFRQIRVGRGGAEFEMIKLRTMVVDAENRLAELADGNEADGPLFKMSNDPRITRVGRFLRGTSIDELPQLWNVLRGQMSVVGPRPALPSELDGWDEQLRDRLRVLPGVTGFWQVSGRSSASFSEYKRLDLYYVDNWSLLHDIEIVLKTVVAVVTQRGAG